MPKHYSPKQRQFILQVLLKFTLLHSKREMRSSLLASASEIIWNEKQHNWGPKLKRSTTHLVIFHEVVFAAGSTWPCAEVTVGTRLLKAILSNLKLHFCGGNNCFCLASPQMPPCKHPRQWRKILLHLHTPFSLYISIHTHTHTESF